MEQQHSSEKLRRELDMLTEYQTRNRQSSESQRSRERRELEGRVNKRSSLLHQKMKEEAQRFEQERNERIRLMQEKQSRELEEFDKESSRIGFT